MRSLRLTLPLALAALALTFAACNPSSEDSTASPTPTGDDSLASEVTATPTAEATLVTDSLASATATAEPTTEATPEPTATPEDCEPTTAGDPSNGVTPLTVNNECLEPLFFAFNQNGGDPFWHLHTEQANTFISLELYTAYGPSWTGETGTFPLDCNQPWGLCLIFDPDGTGPAPVIMWGTGEITINQMDESGYDVTFNGVMPAASDGTVYDFQSTTWTGS